MWFLPQNMTNPSIWMDRAKCQCFTIGTFGLTCIECLFLYDFWADFWMCILNVQYPHTGQSESNWFQQHGFEIWVFQLALRRRGANCDRKCVNPGQKFSDRMIITKMLGSCTTVLSLCFHIHSSFLVQLVIFVLIVQPRQFYVHPSLGSATTTIIVYAGNIKS